MAWKNRLLTVATFAITGFLELFIAPGFSTEKQGQYAQLLPNQKITNSWEISQTYNPPDRGAPSETIGSATRGGECVPKKEKPLTALIPANNLGLTISEYPTFYGYFPKNTGKKAEFVLMEKMEKNYRQVYRKSFPLPTQSGIVRISLPATEKPLEIGKMYQWSLVIVCNPDERSGNAIASGWIERIQPNRTLTNQIKNATPDTLRSVYASSGIWYDALTNLIELRRQQPNNAKLAEDWKKLLDSDSVKLGAFIQEPLLDCCQVK